MAKRERAVRKPPSTRKRSTARKRTTAAIDFKKEIANLRRELSRSRLQQTATADVLNVISRSTFDLQAVLDRLTESAARLCNADMAAITRQDAGGFYHATNYNFSVDWVKVTDTFRIQPGRSSVVGRALLEAKPVQIADVLADPEYTYTEFQKAAGYRTLLGVPLLRSGQPIGVLFLGRKNVELFTHQQVKLVSTFADQALIAIENVRLFDEVQTRTEDLRESLQQQTATADVLKVISRSTFDLQTVLDTLVKSAARVCEADTGIIRRREGDDYPLAATFGLTVQQREHFASYSPKPDRGSVFGRAILEGRTIHVPDVLADPQYSRPRLQGFVSVRAGLGVPLIREGNVIGVFTLQRREPQPFSQKQIELVTSFADQAVIAIENTRLLSELRESLQQQTATADVLKVISRSPGELEPVFQAMLENATRICEAKFSNLFLREGDAFRAVAVHGEPAYMDSWQREPLIVARDHPGVPLDRLARTNEVLHIQDLTAEPPYIEGDRRMIALVDSAGARTMLLVPMLRENALIGAIVIYRQEVRAFTDKQIELVKNFASQAVIAFENARLLNELRESLQQQTATADVLKVISRSTFDLPTVLQTLVESATRLCDADKATITRQKDGVFFRAEAYGFSDEFMDYARTVPVVADRGSAIGRALLERAAIHIPDVEADADFTFTEGRRLGGFRTILGVPMLREGVPIGVITMTRSEVRPFTDKQIELATTFADQAAIAIENVRLFDEVQAKTRDLSDALMYQTGSANILKVIASSPTDVGPVLQAIAESACELCEAVDASVFLRNDNHLTFSGHHGPLSIPDDKMPINRDWVAGRAFLDQKPVHVDDLQSDDGDYLWGRQFAEKHGHRTTLGVPLLRENESIGAIVVRRMEVRPFTVRQIELIRTFADQAVIAIGNVRLFEQVQARTKELSQSLDDLRTAQDRLIQTEKLASLGQLTAGIAHEIKNPLNFVNNFSALSVELVDELDEALKPATLDSKTRVETDELTHMLKGNLEKVVQHGKRADLIVKNMLLHSREGSTERRLVNLNGLVEESLNLAYHGARAENQEFKINLERSFDPTVGKVDLFPQEMTRVLLNLISNGFYAATKRKAEAKFDGYEPTLAAVTRNLGDRVEIRIRDNGGGIPPDVREKIFNPFFTTKPPGQGTGLGLSLSHDIVVKQHSGSIDVDTQPGEFTEFRITLPHTAAASKAGATA